MAIVNGETVGDSMATRIVAAQTSGRYMHVYLGGHLVFDLDDICKVAHYEW